jgi:hypothetical protein
MFGFIFYLTFPFFLAWLMGARRAGALGLACAVALLILGLGFITGLLLTWLIEPSAYWHAYHWPGLWASRYTDSIGYDEPFYKALLIPYVLVLDAARIYVHFSVTHGTLALWIPEVASWLTLRNFYVIYRHFASPLA